MPGRGVRLTKHSSFSANCSRKYSKRFIAEFIPSTSSTGNLSIVRNEEYSIVNSELLFIQSFIHFLTSLIRVQFNTITSSMSSLFMFLYDLFPSSSFCSSHQSELWHIILADLYTHFSLFTFSYLVFYLLHLYSSYSLLGNYRKYCMMLKTKRV